MTVVVARGTSCLVVWRSVHCRPSRRGWSLVGIWAGRSVAGRFAARSPLYAANDRITAADVVVTDTGAVHTSQ